MKSKVDKKDRELASSLSQSTETKTLQAGGRNQSETLSMNHLSDTLSRSSFQSFGGESIFSHMSTVLPVTGIKAIDDLRAAKAEITVSDKRQVVHNYKAMEERDLRKKVE